MIGQGWTNPSKYPSLIEDELVCSMDENDVALQGISFNFEENTIRILKEHITNKLVQLYISAILERLCNLDLN